MRLTTPLTLLVMTAEWLLLLLSTCAGDTIEGEVTDEGVDGAGWRKEEATAMGEVGSLSDDAAGGVGDEEDEASAATSAGEGVYSTSLHTKRGEREREEMCMVPALFYKND